MFLTVPENDELTITSLAIHDKFKIFINHAHSVVFIRGIDGPTVFFDDILVLVLVYRNRGTRRLEAIVDDVSDFLLEDFSF